MKFAICNELYEGWRIEKVFAHAAETGYQGVEIAPFTLARDIRKLSGARRSSIRASARKSGLSIIGLHWLLVQPPGLHINSPDKTARQKSEVYMGDLMNLCADLGGRVLVFGSPQQRKVLPGDTLPDAWQRTAEIFKRLAEQALAKGVIIAIEPLAARDGCNFINTMAEGTLMVFNVASPAFRLHLDVRAMSGEGRPVAESLRLEGGKNLVHFHANDPNSRGPGMGEMAFDPILLALRSIHYDEWVSVEVFDFSAGPEKTAEISLNTLRRSERACQ